MERHEGLRIHKALSQWTDEKKLDRLGVEEAKEMVKSILPSDMWIQLEEELAATELLREG